MLTSRYRWIGLLFALSVLRPVWMAGAEPASGLAASAGEELIIQDDFEDLKLVGSGAVSPGYLEVPPTSYWSLGGRYVLPYMACRDFTLECRIFLDGSGRGGVIFRSNEFEDEFYSFGVSTTGVPSFFKSFGDGKSYMVGINRGKAVPANAWVRLTITAEGDRFTAAIDGQEVASYEDEKHQAGGLAFYTEGCRTRFDDLLLRVKKDAAFRYRAKRAAALSAEDEADPAPNEPFMAPAWSRGQWLTDSDAGPVSFRRKIHLQEQIRSAWIDVACDGKYVLFVNNKEVGSGGKWYRADAYEISDVLEAGENVIVIQVQNKKTSAALVTGEIVDTEGTQIPLHTDDTWEVSRDNVSWQVPRSLGHHPTKAYYHIYKLAYHGPRMDADITAVELPDEIPLGKNFIPCQITFDGPVPVRYPFKLEANLIGGDGTPHALEIAPANEWRVIRPDDNRRTYQLGFAYEDNYLLAPGEYQLHIRIVADTSHKSSEYVRPVTVTRTRAMSAPVRMPGPGERDYTDSRRQHHVYRIDTELQVLVYDEIPYVPLKDSDGAVWVRYEPEKWGTQVFEKIRDHVVLEQIGRYGLTYDPVRCEVADYVDCTQEGHGFSEDGGIGGESRILEINGEDFRVTAPRTIYPAYFYYSLGFKRKHYPHLIVYQTPNDMPRPMTVNPIPSESGSGGVLNGMIYPLDKRNYYQMYVYYPPERDVQLCFMYPVNKMAGSLALTDKRKAVIPRDPKAGAAVSRILSLYIIDPVKDLAPPAITHHRKLGIYYTSPRFISELYGVPITPKNNSEERRIAAFESFLDYLKLAGCNLAQINFLGSDWVENNSAHYDSALFTTFSGQSKDGGAIGYDFFRELVPAAEERDMKVLPFIAPFMFSDEALLKNDALTEDSYLIDKDGKVCAGFSGRKLDPLRPEVQELFLDTVEELAKKSRDFASIEGIGARVTGFGLGFPNGGDVGYSRWDIQAFEAETGISVPASAAEAPMPWLKANCWEEWISWRCRRLAELWRKARDVVVAQRPDMKFVVQVLTAQTSMIFPGNRMPSYEERVRELREWGFDPELYRDEPNLVLQTEWIEEERYKVSGAKQVGLEYDPALSRLFPTREAGGLSIWVGYWEQAGMFAPISRYKPGWLSSASAFPIGRGSFEWLNYGIRMHNAQILSLQNWERGISTQEMALRRFGRAYRSLPAVRPKPFTGKLRIASGNVSHEDLYLAWFDDSLVIASRATEPAQIELNLQRELDENESLKEMGWGWIVAKGAQREVSVELDLQPYDFMVLSVERRE